jgi:RES domain-containing protein
VSETITCWRIASQGLNWLANDLSGNGAALNPGRWNSLDQRILYCSSSIALACLETVVHLAGDDPLPFQRQLVRISIPSHHWDEREIFTPEECIGWELPPSPIKDENWLSATRSWGDDWLLSRKSLLAEVPSVIVPEETNLLLNPLHPAHGEVVAEIVRPWVYDTRLLPTSRSANPKAGPPWHEPLGAGVPNRQPSPQTFPMPDRREQGQSIPRPAPMFELIPWESFRDTPSVRFFDITVAGSNASDLVVDSGPAVSPPNDPETDAWQFYLHSHQEDNLLAMDGGRTFHLVNLSWNYPYHIVRLDCGGDILRIPPGTFYRSVSDPDGSLVLNQAVREEGASVVREFRVYNSSRIPRLFAVISNTPPLLKGHGLNR